MRREGLKIVVLTGQIDERNDIEKNIMRNLPNELE